MKTIPPPCPEPEVGPKYWRSLDQLSETAEFRQWMDREFPSGASELNDPVTRRSFVKIMSASFLLAGVGLTGCRRPEKKILPFSKLPENYVHGASRYYASAMPTRRSAIPLLVRSHEGRPVKVEGNPDHPQGVAGTDAFAQASILNLYDPDRAMRHVQIAQSASAVTGARIEDLLSSVSQQFSANNGQGLSLLFQESSSPTRDRLLEVLAKKFSAARFYLYEPVDRTNAQLAAEQAFGGGAIVNYSIDKAKVIVSLDCDFLGTEENTYLHIRNWAKGRKIEKPEDGMNRLYAVESLMTLTGANADHRLRVPSSSIANLALHLAKKIDGGMSVQSLAPLTDFQQKWVDECAADLNSAKGQGVVLAGSGQPVAVQLLAHVINSALGAVGQSVLVRNQPSPIRMGTLAELATSLQAKQVDTLVILGGNPVYSAPGALNWATAQRMAKTVIRLGYYEDETFAKSDWHIAEAHYLESWGDARTPDGTVVPVQPLIEPLFSGVTEIEVLARLAAHSKASPYDLVRETFAASTGGLNEEAWSKFLHDGHLAGKAAAGTLGKPNAGAVAEALQAYKAPQPPAKDRLEVVFVRDYSLDDGRYNNNGWLMECPDPITKITWDNAILISRATATELGLKNQDIVKVEIDGRSIQGGLWIQPGQADHVLGLQLGYGRERSGRVGAFDGKSVGFNVYPIKPATPENFAVGAKITRVGGTYVFACTQDHWSMEGRPIVREANLDQYKAQPAFAKNMDLEAHAPNAGPIYKHPYNSSPELKSSVHQWGMTIDLSACIGCTSCIIACQSENNIPIVGKEQVKNGREMHWLRIDRYFSGIPELEKGRRSTGEDHAQSYEPWIDDPQVVNQPMMCQHCESAPCESVCPVNATVHDEEGLNLMAYNRCVGTRYCSNNCAWKVRRFNFFDYNKRPIENLYAGPLATKGAEASELMKLARNPDVTVRMRGVMEKCTFCIQRIESSKITQKVQAGASGEVQVPDGAIQTACQQACPAGAIVFGNLLDKESRVFKLKESQRNYAVLGFLDTKPRLTYLAKVRNPNKRMPDFKESPLTLLEYSELNGDPMKPHGAAHSESTQGKGAH